MITGLAAFVEEEISTTSIKCNPRGAMLKIVVVELSNLVPPRTPMADQRLYGVTLMLLLLDGVATQRAGVNAAISLLRWAGGERVRVVTVAELLTKF